MKKRFNLNLISIVFFLAIHLIAITFTPIFLPLLFGDGFTLKQKVQKEADYIIACQQGNPQMPAYGAINNITGDPTWVVPRENAMAILGLILASETLNNNVYLQKAQFTADYLISIQDQTDGAWYNQYNYMQAVDNAKSPSNTAEVMIALAKLGYQHNRYNSMKSGALYLMSCQDIANINGFDHGLLGGGKNAVGQYNSLRWTSDNAYAYWALKASEFWAKIESDNVFADECAQSAQNIIDGINLYLYNPVTGVWYIAIDENGNSVGNPDFPAQFNNLPNWISYSPQMLDVPVLGVNTAEVGDWIKNTFQQNDGSCIAFTWENNQVKTRKYPGYSFQASLCWFDIGQNLYAQNAIAWTENQSGLWQTNPDGNGVSGGWIDWLEIDPADGNKADWWLRFIDTSFYAIACWNGGYNFSTFPWILILNPPWYQTQQNGYSAAAVCKMVLDYIKQDNILTQNEIYNYAHDNNSLNNAAILNIDPQGARSALNNFEPGGYNFVIRIKEEITESMRDICHWMDYEVPNVEIQNVPAIVPVFGSYDIWMAIKGAAASKDPSSADSFTIYGLWAHDPSVNGMGANIYITASEFQNNNFLPLNTQDQWQGKYVSICEPPDVLSRARVTLNNKMNLQTGREFINLLQLRNILPVSGRESLYWNIDQSLFQRQPQYNLIARKVNEFNWNNNIDERLLTDSNFKRSFANSSALMPIKVKRLDKINADYYLVPFEKKGFGENMVSSVILFDALKGFFKQTSWTEKPVKYQLMTKDDAIKLVLKKLKLDVDSLNIQAELAWKPSKYTPSPYYPFWKVTVNSKSWYICNNGNILSSV